MKINAWIKILLVVWMLLMPTMYFLLAASPERGGMMSKMPAVVGEINKVLLPMFKRNTGS
jgi:hypothetical protein|tara:strand:+ start:1206 stop:1385 length:180 start_codon:yes stop_codon:yes gene_type:complete